MFDNAIAWLAAQPLLGLFMTVGAYEAGLWLSRRMQGRGLLATLANPVLVAVALGIAALAATGIPYDRYMVSAQFLNVLLGPTTVALAVPVSRSLPLIRQAPVSILAALVAGLMLATASAVAIAWALGTPPSVLLALLPKSVTLPVALGIVRVGGGSEALTTAAVVFTGLSGAVLGGWVLDRVGVRDRRARGLAVGVAAQSMGTAEAMCWGRTEGAFAGLAFGLVALLAPVLLPVVARWML